MRVFFSTGNQTGCDDLLFSYPNDIIVFKKQYL